jgi:CBS domain containing-hemolysin-like protein
MTDTHAPARSRPRGVSTLALVLWLAALVAGAMSMTHGHPFGFLLAAFLPILWRVVGPCVWFILRLTYRILRCLVSLF